METEEKKGTVREIETEPRGREHRDQTSRGKTIARQKLTETEKREKLAKAGKTNLQRKPQCATVPTIRGSGEN